jgi:hypothetical protein
VGTWVFADVSLTLPDLGACEKVCSAMAALRISSVNGISFPEGNSVFACALPAIILAAELP